MIRGINHINLAVNNIEESFNFYKDILGLTPLCRWDKGAYFTAGSLWFCLSLDPKRSGDPSPCYTHIAFDITEEDFSFMLKRLEKANVLKWKENISEGSSFYFLDPSGHKLEIHVGGWQERLKSKKKSLGSWSDVQYYEPEFFT